MVRGLRMCLESVGARHVVAWDVVAVGGVSSWDVKQASVACRSSPHAAPVMARAPWHHYSLYCLALCRYIATEFAGIFKGLGGQVRLNELSL